MGRFVSVLLALLLAGSAVAQPPANPTAKPNFFDLIQVGLNHVQAALSAPKTGLEVSRDPTLVSPYFLKYPKQRGWGMAYFVRMGMPVTPAAFGMKCSASAFNMLAFGFSAGPDGQARPKACPLLLECKAQTARTNGCFEVEMDVCVSSDRVARINKVTSASFATQLDFKTPAKVSDCTREADRLAKAR